MKLVGFDVVIKMRPNVCERFMTSRVSGSA